MKTRTPKRLFFLAALLLLPMFGCANVAGNIIEKKFGVTDAELKDGGTIYSKGIKHIKAFCSDIAGTKQASAFDTGGQTAFVSYESVFPTSDVSAAVNPGMTVTVSPTVNPRVRCLFFTGTMCAPCKLLHDDFEKRLVKPHGWRMDGSQAADVQLINTDVNPAKAAEYRVDTVPTLILVTPDGREITRQVGLFREGADGAVLASWITRTREWHEKRSASGGIRSTVVSVPQTAAVFGRDPGLETRTTSIENWARTEIGRFDGYDWKRSPQNVSYAANGCPCGCDGNCGGNCGCPNCTCGINGYQSRQTAFYSTAGYANYANQGAAGGGGGRWFPGKLLFRGAKRAGRLAWRGVRGVGRGFGRVFGCRGC